MIKYLNVRSRQRNEFIDITGEVERALEDCGIAEGVCYIYVPHTTAGVTINEGADPAVARDIVNNLSRLVPHDLGYFHREGNADAHIKSSLTGVGLHVPVEAGKLTLGTWQSIYFCEFDGPRHRRCVVKIIQG
ncbi:MAG: secondary thiamine-phosphate synthase enzyme YjbQ [Nitrospiraceae bacterium]|nr:secondary thiamine-phosphate synthase enzyme YjbQ [Nitrospiraceae bacterium]MDA8326571.1 secondary thiamine-phosphate synthase enzyme YjbQ [Nitrospiraceae bacterium]